MINFNAAQISVNVLGLPVQQNPVLTTTPNNNFQALITSMLNSQANSEKADVAAAISASPEIKNALFEAVSTLYLLGKIEAVSSLGTNEIVNEPAVNSAVLNNKLTPDQAQVLASGIKITANEIISGNIQVTNTAANIPAQQPAAGFAPAASNTVVNIPVMPVSGAVIPAAPQSNASPALNIVNNNQAQVVQPVIIAASPAASVQVVAASISNNVPAAVITDTAKPVQVNNQPAAVISPALTADVKPITPVAVNPAEKPAAVPFVLNTMTGKMEINQVSGAEAGKEAAQEASRLIAELQAIVKDFTALIYMLTEKDEKIPAEAKLINNKLAELADKISGINTAAVNSPELIKNITEQAAAILSVIAASVHRITEAFAGVIAPAGLKAESNSTANVLANTGAGAGQDYQGNKQVIVASGLTDQAKDLISQIYGLLGKMNGELYMQQKTDYVYKPFSGSSSQVTKDGVLLINTAVTSGSPAAVLNNMETGAAAITAGLPVLNNTTVQPFVQAQEVAGAVPVITPKPAVEYTVPVVNNGAATAETAPVQPNFIPAMRNSEKAAMLLADSKNKYSRDIDWLKDNISTYLVTVTDTDDAQLPVNVKVFEKAADIAGRVKESIVIKQVVQNIQNAVQVTGRTEIKMFLRPENMGPVMIKLDSSEGVISGRIETANAGVKEILAANLPELKAALASVGLNVSSLDVSVMSNYIGSGLSDSSGNQYREWEGSAVRPDAEETLENAGALNGVDGYLNFLA